MRLRNEMRKLYSMRSLYKMRYKMRESYKMHNKLHLRYNIRNECVSVRNPVLNALWIAKALQISKRY